MRTQKTKDIKFLSFRVSREFWVRVGHAARRLGMTAQAFCIEAIEKHLARADKKNSNGPEDVNGPPARAVIEQIRKAPQNTEEQ